MKRLLASASLLAVMAVAALVAAARGTRHVGSRHAASPAPDVQRRPADDDQHNTADPGAVRVGRPHVLHAAGDPGVVQRRPALRPGFDGRGMTIAIVDSFGSDTMAHDLHVFNQAFGLAADVRRGRRDVRSRGCRPSARSRSRGRPRPRRRRRKQGHGPGGQGGVGARGRARRRDVPRDGAGREHPARHDADRRDARRAGLPADDGRGEVRRRQPPRERDLAELRLGGGRVRERQVAPEPA